MFKEKDFEVIAGNVELSIPCSTTEKLKIHYKNKFNHYGAEPRGVDWGDNHTAYVRYIKILELIPHLEDSSISLLDVGCGYGGLLEELQKKKIKIQYFGIDVVEEMISYAKTKYQNFDFQKLDIFSIEETNLFDYVVCNGILTQKLDESFLQFEMFSKQLIQKLFSICRLGCCFNVMSNRVNFMVNNLFYKSPSEMLSFCLEHVTSNIKIDHSYGLYEYTVYLYKNSQHVA